MFIPTRRNRNIGTSKQGYGIDNKLVIPNSWHDSSVYYEKLDKYTVVKKLLKNKEYVFLVEHTRKCSFHACSIDDFIKILSSMPEQDLEGLNLFVLRQPKRKEETLKPVWGRLIYFIEIDKQFEGPSIVIEAMDFSRKIKWRKSQKPEDRKEFERIIEDGHQIIDNKKEFIIKPTITNNRNTQLYRTLLHEIGHYVQFLEIVKRPAKSLDDSFDLNDQYDKIPTNEKEVFAHKYADAKKNEFLKNGIIPFDRIIDLESIKKDKLRIEDFMNEDK